MAWDGIYRLTDPLMSGDQVKLIQKEAIRRFASYAVPLGVTVNGLYDEPTADFITVFQARRNNAGYKPALPANATAQPGDCDYETKRALGILPVITPPPAGPKFVGYAFPGTWGVWNVGPQCMAVNRAPNVWVQGVQWNTAAFLNPDPHHSYVESRAEGVAEFMRLALPDPRPKVLSGYSMGADVVTRALLAWPADRRHEIRGVIKFGDPGHLPNAQGSVHGGISRIYTPEWAVDRTTSYQISGDMYGDAPGLVPAFYDLLTRMEMSGEFMKYLFTWLTGIPLDLGSILGQVSAPPNRIGEQMLGLSGMHIPGFGALAPILGLITPGGPNQTAGPISLAQMLLNLPAIAVSLLALLKFLFSNAHAKYWVDPIFDGLTAEDHAAATVRQLTAR